MVDVADPEGFRTYWFVAAAVTGAANGYFTEFLSDKRTDRHLEHLQDMENIYEDGERVVSAGRRLGVGSEQIEDIIDGEMDEYFEDIDEEVWRDDGNRFETFLYENSDDVKNLSRSAAEGTVASAAYDFIENFDGVDNFNGLEDYAPSIAAYMIGESFGRRLRKS